MKLFVPSAPALPTFQAHCNNFFNCVTLRQPITIEKCPGSGRWSGLELIDLWDFCFWFSFLSDRLRDTLIHEMCHAASWIISGVKAGHGPVWKKWWVSKVDLLTFCVKVCVNKHGWPAKESFARSSPLFWPDEKLEKVPNKSLRNFLLVNVIVLLQREKIWD